MDNNDYTCVDLFAGAGGLSCGLAQAGFTCLLGSDIHPVYAKTFQHNHPNAVVLQDDIRNVSAGSIRERLGLKKGDLDLLAGGPPCQGFSVNAPIRSLDDERNHLFKWFIAVAEELLPGAVLIENVPGIISLGRGTVVEQIHASLAKLGYSVGHRILFAAHYGVPQMRYRTIFVGIRGGRKPVFPPPQCDIKPRGNFRGAKELCIRPLPLWSRGLKPPTAVWEAISDLPELENGEVLDPREYHEAPTTDYQLRMRGDCEVLRNHVVSRIAEINLKRLEHIPRGGSWRDIPFELLPKGLQRARRSDHTKRYGRLDPKGLCSTILTKCDPHWGSFFHPYQERVLSVREAARIQSFPDKFVFLGSVTQQYQQVGNAVPPAMAEAIGRQIINSLRQEGEC